MTFHALDISLQLIRSLRKPLVVIRRRSPDLARQIERAAASISANASEGSRRVGKDRAHLFRVAEGSAAETRTHLRVPEAFGWVDAEQIEEALALCDRQVAILYRLGR